MTIPSTTVYAAKSALYASLTSAAAVPNAYLDPAAPPLLIAYGVVGKYLPDDIILIGRVTRQTVPYHMVGSGAAGWLKEDFIIEVGVSCFRGGDDAWSHEQAVWRIVDFIEATVRADPSLTATVSTAFPTQSEIDPTWEDDHKGVLFTGHVHIQCTAVI